MSTELIYKICTTEEWAEAKKDGRYSGSALDLKDGFIHFSTAKQAQETARRHFAGQTGLVLVSIDPAALNEPLKWEPSRGGDLFPHLYVPLDLNAVHKVTPLPLGDDGVHVFPKVLT
jgi:uncharacterized protein (DUF952 family)